MRAARSYFVADHQTGETAHYPSAAQAVAAGRALAWLKVHAQRLDGLREQKHPDGWLYLGVPQMIRADVSRSALVSVGRLYGSVALSGGP